MGSFRRDIGKGLFARDHLHGNSSDSLKEDESGSGLIVGHIPSRSPSARPPTPRQRYLKITPGASLKGGVAYSSSAASKEARAVEETRSTRRVQRGELGARTHRDSSTAGSRLRCGDVKLSGSSTPQPSKPSSSGSRARPVSASSRLGSLSDRGYSRDVVYHRICSTDGLDRLDLQTDRNLAEASHNNLPVETASPGETTAAPAHAAYTFTPATQSATSQAGQQTAENLNCSAPAPGTLRGVSNTVSWMPCSANLHMEVPWPLIGPADEDSVEYKFNPECRKWFATEFPARWPNTRKQVNLLNDWLTDELEALRNEAVDNCAPHGLPATQDGEDGLPHIGVDNLLERCRAIYTAAFQEAIRQTKVQCVERGRLLTRLAALAANIKKLEEVDGTTEVVNLQAQIEYLKKFHVDDKLNWQQLVDRKEAQLVAEAQKFEHLRSEMEVLQGVNDGLKEQLALGGTASVSKKESSIQKWTSAGTKVLSAADKDASSFTNSAGSVISVMREKALLKTKLDEAEAQLEKAEDKMEWDAKVAKFKIAWLSVCLEKAQLETASAVPLPGTPRSELNSPTPRSPGRGFTPRSVFSRTIRKVLGALLPVPSTQIAGGSAGPCDGGP
ncbi:hypothetical protein CYMTET_16112 [Cymbomonas tetramitiformis]|uniref:Uncharacterized protein n=1 Tax=Cymbomonas tetramitiformis TaxID=36881 RepID=A0AAE0L893_9CHLO|nr:hypothetical protein CYMTET_16112 [Cymbomonas tetramitiformis]